MPMHDGLQAIQVKYIAPTDKRIARYKATASAGTLTLSAEYRLGGTENATRVAKAFANKYGWLDGDWHLVSGVLPNGDWVFVLVNNEGNN